MTVREQVADTRPSSPRTEAAPVSRWPSPFLVGYFARQWLLLWAAALAAVAELAIMVQRGMQWRGDLVWTLDWLPVSFMIVGPVLAGCVAIDTARTADGAGHLSRNPVLRTPAFAVWLAYTVVLGAIHLLVVTVALGLSMPPVGDAFAPLAVLCQLLILAFFAALGTAVGRFTRPLLAGVCGALAAFAAMYVVSAPADHLVLLEFGGATIPRVGYAYSGAFLGWQAVALLLAIAALLVLRPLDATRDRSIAPRDAVAAAVLVAGVVAVSMTVPDDRLEAVDAAPTSCGAAQGVPTCFYPQHERVAGAFTEQFWVLVDVARNSGYDDLVPERVEEASRTQLPQEDDPDVAAFYVMPDHLQGQQPTLWEIAGGIVQPLHCPQLQGELPPSERYWSDLNALVGTWVGLVDPALAEDGGYLGSPLPAERAAEIVEGFRTCTYPHF